MRERQSPDKRFFTIYLPTKDMVTRVQNWGQQWLSIQSKSTQLRRYNKYLGNGAKQHIIGYFLYTEYM